MTRRRPRRQAAARLVANEHSLAARAGCAAASSGPDSASCAARQRLRTPHDTGPELRLRARDWALALGMVFLAHSADNPVMARIGRRTVQAVLSDC